MTDTVKIKITPNTVSGSTQDQQDVAKLSFTNNSISSSVPLLVNNEKVIYENNFLRWDASQGILRPETVYVQKELLVNGQKPIMSSDVFKVENGVVLTKDLRVNNEKVLYQNQYLKFDETTGKLTANSVQTNDLKVKGLDVLTSSENLQIVNNTVTVKDLNVTTSANLKSLKVDNQDVLLSSPDLSFDATTGTLTVRRLRTLEEAEVA
jgi:hypothetical protein